jgi:formyltetrahydrofolate deformylase
MQVIVTAVGPENQDVAEPLVQQVTAAGGTIAEIQMYDHDAAGVSAMFLRLNWPGARASIATLRTQMNRFGRDNGLVVRTWSSQERQGPPRLALCVTHRPEPPRAVLRAIQEGGLRAVPAVVIGNRPTCRGLAEEFGIDWHCIGDGDGQPDNHRLVELFDRYDVDYIVLARYMRLIPPDICRQFAGGRIVNLHHGLLPAFPGAQPYHDAYRHRMLTYGATVHFIVPDLDAGDQIIHQGTFSVEPGTPLERVLDIGQGEHEPACLVEGLRRVLEGEVELRFHKVVAVSNGRRSHSSLPGSRHTPCAEAHSTRSVLATGEGLGGEPNGAANGTCQLRNVPVVGS